MKLFVITLAIKSFLLYLMHFSRSALSIEFQIKESVCFRFGSLSFYKKLSFEFVGHKEPRSLSFALSSTLFKFFG